MKQFDESKKDELGKQEVEEPALEDFLVNDNEDGLKRRNPMFGRIVAVILVLALLSSVFGVWVKVFNLPSFEFLKKSSELSKEKMIQTYKDSIVTVEGNDIKGTGFNIDPEGKIITNYHIIENMNRIIVSFPNGNFYQADVLIADSSHDFALLDIDGKHLPFLELEDRTTWQKGDEIVVIGNPLAYTRIAIDGTILSTSNDLMMIDAPIHKGNSGSPVINQRGKVIGIVYAKTIPRVGQGDKVEGLVIPLDRIRNHLEN